MDNCAYRKSRPWLNRSAPNAANRMFNHALPGSIVTHEKSPLIGEQNEHCPFGQREIGTVVLGIGISSRLPRSRCASLVAVVKPANLRYGNYGADFRRVHGPQFRRFLGQRQMRPGFMIIGQE